MDCLNLTTETDEIISITSEQQHLLVKWERIRSKALHRLGCLESRSETKSNTSNGPCRSVSSWRSSKSHSSCKDALLGVVAKRAVLQQRLSYADLIEDQEKLLAKSKIEQELSETLAEEAIH